MCCVCEKRGLTRGEVTRRGSYDDGFRFVCRDCNEPRKDQSGLEGDL